MLGGFKTGIMEINLDDFAKLKKGSVIVCTKVDKYHTDWFTVGNEYTVISSKIYGNYIRDDRNCKNQNVYGHSYFKLKQ